MYYVRLGIHMGGTQACVLDSKGALVCNERIKTDVSDIGHLFKRIETNDDEIRMVMEATGFYFWIHDCIVAFGNDVWAVHPAKVKPMMMMRAKNDRNDAYMLANLLRSNSLNGIYVPSKEVREMRELTSHCDSLVWKKGGLRREVAHLLQNNIKAPKECCSNFTKKHVA